MKLFLLLFIFSTIAVAADGFQGKDVLENAAVSCSSKNYEKLLTWSRRTNFAEHSFRPDEFSLVGNTLVSKDGVVVGVENKTFYITVNETRVIGGDPCELAMNVVAHFEQKVTESGRLDFLISAAHAADVIPLNKVQHIIQTAAAGATMLATCITTGAIVIGLPVLLPVSVGTVGVAAGLAGALCAGSAIQTVKLAVEYADAVKLKESMEKKKEIFCDKNSITLQTEDFKFVVQRAPRKLNQTFMKNKNGVFAPYAKIPQYQIALYKTLEDMRSTCLDANGAMAWTETINSVGLERTKNLASFADLYPRGKNQKNWQGSKSH